MKGIKDSRGQLFWNYIDLIEKKQPLFFLAENVPGILSPQHKPEFMRLIKNAPKDTEIILTGRGDISEIEGVADYVTIMVDKKHPFGKNIGRLVI